MSQDNDLSEVVNKIVGEITSTTTLPAIQFTLVKEETTIFNSKMGGKPYLPKGFEYPKTYDDELHPLALLAQINFEEFEELEDFPNKGILQFYISGNDDFGMDYHDFLNSNGFRVIYHEHIVTDESLLVDPPEISEAILPVDRCYKLIGKKVNMTMTLNDFRMETLLKKYASKYDIDKDELFDQLQMGDQLSFSDTAIGGYGDFSQDDPRSYEGKYKDYLVTLFTSSSDNDICWGDCGIGNFFIKKEDLLKKNFNDVLYTWDCT
ncbi:YwqG family protein [Entamoeba marina]